MAVKFTIDFEEALQAYSGTADEAEAAVVGMGINHAQRPSSKRGDPADIPDFPDLSESTPEELAHYMSIFTAWHNYANGRLVYFKKIRDQEVEKRKFAWSYLRRGKAGTVTDKDDEVTTDSRYVDINRQYMYADNIVRDLECIADNLDRSVKTISRVISVLQQRLEVEGMSAHMERKKVQQKSDVMRHFSRETRR